MAYLALFVALGGTASAATGGSFILGKANTDANTSTLTNTGKGAALTLRSTSAYPPLAVSNSRQVNGLNSALLNGLTAAKIESKGRSLNGLTATQIEAAARSGLFSHVTNYDGLMSLSAGQQATVDEYCPSGTVAIGGSVNIIPDGDGSIQVSRPDGDTSGDSPNNAGSLVGWRGIATGTQNGDLMDVHVYCAS